MTLLPCLIPKSLHKLSYSWKFTMTGFTFITIHCNEYVVESCNVGNCFSTFENCTELFYWYFSPFFLFPFFWKSIIQILGLLDEYSHLLNFSLPVLISSSLCFSSWELFSFTFWHFIAILCWTTLELKQKKKNQQYIYCLHFKNYFVNLRFKH